MWGFQQNLADEYNIKFKCTSTALDCPDFSKTRRKGILKYHVKFVFYNDRYFSQWGTIE